MKIKYEKSYENEEKISVKEFYLGDYRVKCFLSLIWGIWAYLTEMNGLPFR